MFAEYRCGLPVMPGAPSLPETGKLDEAEPLYRKAVEIGEAVLGPEHPDLATWLNNLATLMRDMGDPAAAEPLQRRAVSIGERALGPGHPDLGAQVINLASLLSAQGEGGGSNNCELDTPIPTLFFKKMLKGLFGYFVFSLFYVICFSRVSSELVRRFVQGAFF